MGAVGRLLVGLYIKGLCNCVISDKLGTDLDFIHLIPANEPDPGVISQGHAQFYQPYINVYHRIYLKVSGLWDINEQPILHYHEIIYLKLNYFVVKGHQVKYATGK
jgi:hypothetical protein